MSNTIFFKNRFHVTHYAGCAILFNKDISVKSIYLHDTRRGVQDHIVEGEQGWVLQGVLSRATSRRSPVSGQKYFTVLSLHISNIHAKKKGIAKKLIQTLRAIMISQEVDLVAGDFNGTAWRCRSRNNLSTIDEASADCALPHAAGPHTFAGTWIHSGQLGRRLWISQTPGSQRFWKVNKHMVPFHSLGKLLANDQMIKAAIMGHGFIYVSSIGATNGTIKRTTTGTSVLRNSSGSGVRKGHISEVLSDHSLSS